MTLSCLCFSHVVSVYRMGVGWCSWSWRDETVHPGSYRFTALLELVPRRTKHTKWMRLYRYNIRGSMERRRLWQDYTYCVWIWHHLTTLYLPGDVVRFSEILRRESYTYVNFRRCWTDNNRRCTCTSVSCFWVRIGPVWIQSSAVITRTNSSWYYHRHCDHSDST